MTKKALLLFLFLMSCSSDLKEKGEKLYKGGGVCIKSDILFSCTGLEWAYSKKLISAGLKAQQTEVQSEALAELVNDQLVTKKDLNEMELRLTLRLGGMMAASIALVATSVKLF